MPGGPPKMIITDQNPAMAKAIAFTLPDTYHRLCIWHIVNKFSQKLGALAYVQHYEEFKKCIWNSENLDEFEARWLEIVQKAHLSSNEWLNDMYTIRARWIPAYTKHIFSAHMTSSQRSESDHAFFKRYVSKNNSLLEFVTQFDRALSNLRHNELDLDHKDVNEKPVLKTSWLLEKRMSELYTRTIFYKFQEEIHQKDAYVFTKMDEDEHRCLWNVQRVEIEGSRCREILVNKSSNHVSCSCKMLEFEGIPCRHMLTYFARMQIMALPDQYILWKWTVAAKASRVLDDLGGERGKELCGNSILMRRQCAFQLFLNVVDDALLTEDGTQVLEEALESITKRVALMKISREDGEGSGIRVPVSLGSQLSYKEPLPVRAKGCGKIVKYFVEAMKEICGAFVPKEIWDLVTLYRPTSLIHFQVSAITSGLRFTPGHHLLTPIHSRRSPNYATVRLRSVLVKIGIGRSSSLFDPLWCGTFVVVDMSNRQFHLTSPLQDSSTQISSFEDSLTSPILANAGENANANANANANEADVGVGVEANDVVIEVIEEESNPFKKKEIKKTSAVWNDFQPITFPDGSKKHQCKFCKDYFTIQAPGSTTHLIRHLKTCVQRRLQLGLSEKRQKTLSFEAGGSESGNLTTFTYDHAKVREAASHMILYHEYPLIHMEHVLFNKFMKTTTPHWQKISRAVAKNDCQRIQYMVMTGHYVDEDWKLQKRVLSFCNVPPPHNGVATITVDNTSYNDVALRNLKSTFQLLKKKLPLDDGVKYLIHSEASLTQCSDIAKQLKLPLKKLILNCPTRWNSTYMMLSAALEFKDVFSRYSERDVSFSYVPTYEEWERVENVCQFLKIFNDVTNIIASCEYPTSNLFLTEIWRVKEILDKNSVSEFEYLRSMALKMKGKFDKYWGECNLVKALGAALDPRYKLLLIGFCFLEIYGDKVDQNTAMVRESLYDLYDEYVVMHSQAYNEQILRQSSTEVCSLSSVAQGKKVATGKSKYESFVRKADTFQPVKSDLDIYLEEGVYICAS
ncbi:hypothetical protein RHSIM_RhsimUnG0122000 [Rhododendron simsii]|uniref:Protein FAR1-RELATED SEQUENCE n=1 Tax=Rhododendron simsii TaxID=118357 RepID=A0A834L4B6_RHOSS|nr:hypothetical protein RHSIM_RhsimUnG0122000 [Rhododendron simsii]